jgi:hypothetical protein
LVCLAAPMTTMVCSSFTACVFSLQPTTVHRRIFGFQTVGFESHADSKDLLLFCFHFSATQAVLLSYYKQPSGLCYSELNFFERVSDYPSAVLLNYTDMMYCLLIMLLICVCVCVCGLPLTSSI